MDEQFICPFPWRWSAIYEKLRSEWQERDDQAIPEPPLLLPPITNDAHRQERWQETVEWAEEHGFVIPTLSEDEKYYRM